MNNHEITNLSTDTEDVLSAADVSYVNQAKADLTLLLTISFIKKINESHISSSNSKTNVFRYIVGEVDESTGENRWCPRLS